MGLTARHCWRELTPRVAQMLGPPMLMPASAPTTSTVAQSRHARILSACRRAPSGQRPLLKSIDITFSTKVCIVKAMVFPVVVNGCESWTVKKGWVPKNWCFWIVMLEKTLESPLDSKEIKPINPKGNQPWIFIGRTDAEAEALILWPPDSMSWLIRKDIDAGKDWRQVEKGTTEDEMVGWHGIHTNFSHE